LPRKTKSYVIKENECVELSLLVYQGFFIPRHPKSSWSDDSISYDIADYVVIINVVLKRN